MQLPWNARVIALCVLALSASTQVSAAQVRIAQEAHGYRLLVDGAPFVIKGAGLGNGSMETLAARGAMHCAPGAWIQTRNASTPCSIAHNATA